MTSKQRKVLDHVKRSGPVRTGFDGTQLAALQRKGFVTRHQFSEGQRLYYTWTITNDGIAALQSVPKDRFGYPQTKPIHMGKMVADNSDDEGWIGL